MVTLLLNTGRLVVSLCMLPGPSPLEAMMMGEEKDGSKTWVPPSTSTVSSEEGATSPQPEGDESKYMCPRSTVKSAIGWMEPDRLPLRFVPSRARHGFIRRDHSNGREFPSSRREQAPSHSFRPATAQLLSPNVRWSR